MSSHVATVSLGRTGSASGDLKTADAVGHLYIGGAGAWHFHRLSDDDNERSLTLPSSGFDGLWQEVAAGFAVLMADQPGLERVADGLVELGVDAATGRVAREAVPALAALVSDVNVAAALTVFDGSVPPEVAVLDAVPGWSVQVAAPVFERVYSRWGTSDTRASAAP